MFNQDALTWRLQNYYKYFFQSNYNKNLTPIHTSIVACVTIYRVFSGTVSLNN